MAFIAHVCHALLIMRIQPSSQALSISAFTSLLVEQLNVWAKSCLSQFKPISTLENTHTKKSLFPSYLLQPLLYLKIALTSLSLCLDLKIYTWNFLCIFYTWNFLFFISTEFWMAVFLNRHLYLKFYFYRPRICTKVFVKTFISTLKVLHGKYQATNLGQWNKAFLNSCIRNEADTQGMTWRQRE